MSRLSRNFITYPSDEVMSNAEIKIKSGVAVTLGIIPFLSTKLWLYLFRYSAESNIKMFGCCSAGLMMLSAKVFSLSQKVAWGHYVEHPSGDTENSRLAQYGSSNQPWTDFKTICKAYFRPERLTENEWSLVQWASITI